MKWKGREQHGIELNEMEKNGGKQKGMKMNEKECGDVWYSETQRSIEQCYTVQKLTHTTY